MSGPTVELIAGLAITTALIKAAGPIAFGGRDLPAKLAAIVGMLAPALLAALVVTQALAHEDHLLIGPVTAGVAVGGIAAWYRVPAVGCVVAAAAVTAALRALT